MAIIDDLNKRVSRLELLHLRGGVMVVFLGMFAYMKYKR